MICEKNDRKLKIAIINLGCKVNKYESDSMKDKLSENGFEIVEEDSVADVYIVNTCSVTNMAQKKSRQMLRRAKKMNPDAIIVAAGCYVNAEHDVLKAEDFVDVVVGNNCKKDIVTAIREYIENQSEKDYYIDINKTKEYEEMGSLAVANMDHRRAYVKIQDGCNQFCSYCIIPYTRGRVRSRKATDVIEEVTNLAKAGIKEFVLTGIHISSYGVDFVGGNAQYDDMIAAEEQNEENSNAKTNEISNLGQLINALSKIPEVERIRLGSLEPRIVTEEFLKDLKDNHKFCPHFHLSLQSACNDTLKRMNRKYTIEDFADKCEMIRRYFDKPAITTDVIVGFPGETEEEFQVTIENLTKINLYEIHVFKYSVRSGTVAEKMPNQVPEQIKGFRSDVLLELTAKQKKAYEETMAGEYDEVLVEERLLQEKTEDLKEAHIVSEGTEHVLDSNKDDVADVVYYTGHTKRYVKVKIASNQDIVNQIVRVKMD